MRAEYQKRNSPNPLQPIGAILLIIQKHLPYHKVTIHCKFRLQTVTNPNRGAQSIARLCLTHPIRRTRITAAWVAQRGRGTRPLFLTRDAAAAALKTEGDACPMPGAGKDCALAPPRVIPYSLVFSRKPGPASCPVHEASNMLFLPVSEQDPTEGRERSQKIVNCLERDITKHHMIASCMA
jgi:hypothetical protein